MRLAESLRYIFPRGMTLLWVPDPSNAYLFRVFAVGHTDLMDNDGWVVLGRKGYKP